MQTQSRRDDYEHPYDLSPKDEASCRKRSRSRTPDGKPRDSIQALGPIFENRSELGTPSGGFQAHRSSLPSSLHLITRPVSPRTSTSSFSSGGRSTAGRSVDSGGSSVIHSGIPDGTSAPGLPPVSPRSSRGHGAPQARQRTAVACRYCRKRKIRCTGISPEAADPRCSNCRRLDQECIYAPVGAPLQDSYPRPSAFFSGERQHFEPYIRGSHDNTSLPESLDWKPPQALRSGAHDSYYQHQSAVGSTYVQRDVSQNVDYKPGPHQSGYSSNPYGSHSLPSYTHHNYIESGAYAGRSRPEPVSMIPSPTSSHTWHSTGRSQTSQTTDRSVASYTSDRSPMPENTHMRPLISTKGFIDGPSRIPSIANLTSGLSPPRSTQERSSHDDAMLSRLLNPAQLSKA